MIDKADAEKITIPHLVLASKDEDPGQIREFEEGLKGEKYVETFGGMIHGWMSARGDLEDEEVRKEYERGYKTVLEFFEKHL